MDPLSALAVVTAAVQFLDYGERLLKKAWAQWNTAEYKREMAQLLGLAERLSTLLKAGQRVPDDDPVEKPETAAERELRRVNEECHGITSDFHDIINRRKRQSKPKSLNIFGGGGWDMAKWKEGMSQRLGQVRDQAVVSVLFCLWEESKQASKREVHFAQQYKDLTDLLERVENSLESGNGRTSQKALDENMSDIVVDDGLGTSLVPMIQGFRAEKMSAEKIREIRRAVNEVLHGELRKAKEIRHELVHYLWATSWKPDDSVDVYESTSTALSNMVVNGILKSLRFETIQTREEAVIDSFDKTYSWIFDRTPVVDNGRQMWPSFPYWLESADEKQYWITGKPGSGKSTIMKFILGHEGLNKHLSQWAGTLPLLVTKYYAWNSGLTLQKSLEGLKRTLLHQALSRNPKLAQTLAPRRWAFLVSLRDGTLDLPAWESWEIEESFHALLSECGKRVMLAVFIDGLDEFDSPPLEVIKSIQEMAASCQKGLKLCMASRPWYEFDDAFTDAPQLHMHLLTKQDMAAFVSGQMGRNKGFLEVKQVYPEEADDLMESVVLKANGIFLWVSLVVRDLLLSLSQGTSLSGLQTTLESLPSDISSLYDSIWSRIPQGNLHDASFMIQVVRAAQPPMRWLLMWVADESRVAPVDLSSRPAWNMWKPAAWRNLKRRLASRTRGLLEISSEVYHAGPGGSSGTVDFAHRTVRTWAFQSDVWKQIRSAYQGQVDPFLTLLQAESVIFADERERSTMEYTAQWRVVLRALWYGSQVEDIPQNTPGLVEALDNVKDAAIDLKWQPSAQFLTQDTERWVLPGWAQRFVTTFVGMAAQFAILAYIRVKVRSDPDLLCRQRSRNTLGLLENAIFGYKYYLPTHYHSTDGFSPSVQCGQRLETVDFLLNEGVVLTDAHSHLGILPVRDLVRIASNGDLTVLDYDNTSEEDESYYLKVAEYLESRSLKSKWKSVSLRMRRTFSS